MMTNHNGVYRYSIPWTKELTADDHDIMAFIHDIGMSFDDVMTMITRLVFKHQLSIDLSMLSYELMDGIDDHALAVHINNALVDWYPYLYNHLIGVLPRMHHDLTPYYSGMMPLTHELWCELYNRSRPLTDMIIINIPYTIG